MILGSPAHLAWVAEQLDKQRAYEQRRREWYAANNIPDRRVAMRGSNPGKGAE